MKRSGLIKLLNDYNLIASEEIEFKARMLAFIAENVDCFERSLQDGHITASSWLLSKDQKSALLMHHAKLNNWVQLGGHCDGEHDVLAVAIKEAQEESGIMAIAPISSAIFDIDIHLIPANSREKAHYHYDVRFLLQVISDEVVIPNQESKELRWIGQTIHDLPTNSLSVVRMFHKWLKLAN